jgi:hypothetical protein
VGVSSPIRTSSFLVLLALSGVSCLACAKGTEISTSEIVVLQLLPPGAPDAGADGGAVPIEPPADEAAPAGADAEL